MRIIRFLYKGKESWGIVKDGRVKLLKAEPFSKIIITKETVPFKNVQLLVPAQAGKIVLVGLNYKDHARELKMKIPKEPIIFLKPATALIAHKHKIIYPRGVTRLDYEAELALVIKKKAKNITEKDAHKYILGYTCLNDVTARDIQKKDGQWTRAKSFDTFCPVGPWVETDLDPSDVKITSFLNKKIKQESSTANFIFSVPFLVAFISRVMTLLPGDIISTGTPSGVGKMKPSDNISVAIEGIGQLENTVIKE
ncbi:MAG: fumarylacetoacetate hydrolase family protein [Candidatus Omnitrophota bacterium]